MRGQERGSHRPHTTALPPHPIKSGHTDPITYLERVAIHFAVLCIHLAEAVMPTQGGSVGAAGEAF